MQITLYKNFSKRRNSTKQPTGGTTANVVFKDGCSTENPIFLINGVDLAVNYIGFNSGYYFVDDIVLGNNNIYELHCSIDVLATWKSLIGSYNAFIERSASAYDVKINDNAVTAQQTFENYSEASSTVGAFYGTGCYVIQVMSQDGINFYASESLEPWGTIFNPASYSAASITAWIDSKIAQAFDLDVYLGTVKWLPVNASTISDGNGALGALHVGPLLATMPTTVGNRTYKCTDLRYAGTSGEGITLTLPSASLPYSDFRLCNNKFSQWVGYFPGVGLVDLDASIMGAAILNNETIKCSAMLDLMSGNVTYILRHGATNSKKFAEFSGNMAVDVPIGKASYNAANQITSTVSGTAAAVASAASQNYVGAAASVVGTIVSVADNAVNPQVSILSGGAGNIGQLKNYSSITIGCRSYGSKDIPQAVYGRPLYEWRTINTLSGFVRCNAASIDIPGAAPNKDTVNAYLNSGFYYE